VFRRRRSNKHRLRVPHNLRKTLRPEQHPSEERVADAVVHAQAVAARVAMRWVMDRGILARARIEFTLP